MIGGYNDIMITLSSTVTLPVKSNVNYCRLDNDSLYINLQ